MFLDGIRLRQNEETSRGKRRRTVRTDVSFEFLETGSFYFYHFLRIDHRVAGFIVSIRPRESRRYLSAYRCGILVTDRLANRFQRKHIFQRSRSFVFGDQFSIRMLRDQTDYEKEKNGDSGGR